MSEADNPFVFHEPELIASIVRNWEAYMPSKSKLQARTMQAAAHNPAFAKKVGIPQSVAKDFAAADDKRGTKKLPARKK